jgi:predicted ATP-grasp superfamily ATP-dependent carboligase
VSEIRPLERADLPAVAGLYEYVARSGSRVAPPGVVDYFERFFFDHPWADPEIPALVYEDADGRIAGFIGSHVRRFRFDGRPIRVGCSGQLVTEPTIRNRAAGAFLMREYLAGPQDVTITDTASETVRRIWEKLGGGTLHTRCVGWVRVFKPWQFGTEYVTRQGKVRVPSRVTAPLAAGLDAVSGLIPALRTERPQASGEELTAAALVEHLPAVTRGLRLVPDYDVEFLSWLFREMAAVSSHGRLVGSLVRNARGEVAGWYVYYLREGGISHVMHLAAAPRQEDDVLEHLFDDARRRGAAALQGRLEPALLEPLSRHRCLLHPSGYLALIHSRSPEIEHAIVMGHGLLTRMEGEWWMGHHLEPSERPTDGGTFARDRRSLPGPSRRVQPARPRVLVSGGEYVGVLAAVRGLRAAGYEPWVTVTTRRGYARYSRAVGGSTLVPDPARDPGGFVGAVTDAVERLPAAAFLPGTETALHSLAARRDRFPAGVALGICPPEAVEAATDKSILGTLAAEAGLETPPTLHVSAPELNGHGAAIGFPAVVKPLRSELDGGNGAMRHWAARRVESESELASALGELPGGSGLLQSFIPGRVTAVGGVFWEGEIVAAVHQAAERIWPVDCGVISYATTVARDGELEDALARLLARIGWQGLFQVQFVEYGAQRYLIDLNPRIYGSLALALAAGQNLTGIWVDLLLGRSPTIGGYRTGVRYRAEELDFRALAKLARRGRIGELTRGLVPRPRTVHAVFARDDPLPLLTSIGSLVAALRA